MKWHGIESSYAVLRRDDMLRDPDLVSATNFLMWVPMAVVTAGLAWWSAHDNDAVSPIVAGGLALIAYGVGVALVETQRQ